VTETARVLFAIPELASGGPDRVFYEVISGLDRAFFAPQLLVVRVGGRYFAELPPDVEHIEIGGGRYPIWRFARAVDRLRPDLIVTTLRMNVTAAAARPLQRHKPPVIARQANAIAMAFSELRKKSLMKHRVAELITKWLLRTPAALVAQSSDMAGELKRHATADQKVEVIGNPISLERVDAACRQQDASDRPVKSGRPQLVAVGRLAPQKGFDLLIPAFAEFLKEYPQAALKILGDGPDRAALATQARTLGVEHAVVMPGHCEDVLAQVQAADIFVSSSRYEGFSNAILEAMALRRTVVATNCDGATKDLIINGETGILVDGIDVPSLVEGLRRAMKCKRELIGSTARLYVEEEFRHDRIVEKYADLFRSLIATTT